MSMSKRQLYGLSLLVALILPSCMGDGSGSINYHRVGVIREEPVRCVYTTDEQGNIFIVSSADLEGREELKDGDCCIVDFRTNFRNALADGVYEAEILRYDSVAVWPLRDVLTDTAAVLESERLVTLDFKKSVFLEGRFFLQTQHSNHQADQKDLFDLSYDPGQTVEVDEEGQRIYNLYLRVTQDGGTGDSSRWIKTTAFVIEPFLDWAKEREIEEGADAIHFKINYVERYNADTTACIWAATDPFTLRFTN